MSVCRISVVDKSNLLQQEIFYYAQSFILKAPGFINWKAKQHKESPCALSQLAVKFLRSCFHLCLPRWSRRALASPQCLAMPQLWQHTSHSQESEGSTDPRGTLLLTGISPYTLLIIIHFSLQLLLENLILLFFPESCVCSCSSVSSPLNSCVHVPPLLCSPSFFIWWCPTLPGFLQCKLQTPSWILPREKRKGDDG